MIKKLLVLSFVVFSLWGQAGLGYYSSDLKVKDKGVVPILSGRGFKGEITDTAADFWWIFWTGVGNLSDITVSNTAQGGYFGRPSDVGDYFDATQEQWVKAYQGGTTAYRGLTAEYPVNSNQFYTYSAGVWVGALYPVIDTVSGDTTWKPNVSKGAYSSDMGGMNVPEMDSAGEVGDISGVGLYFSDQIIPDTNIYSHAGEFLFVQQGETQEPYQALWPFADTTLNSRRPLDQQLDLTNGDIISNQDTYAVAGDWIPDSNASCIWTRDAGPYDVWGLGIRVEQRTYSFNMPENKDYVYINYKIRNINPFPLKNLYFGYFMDNDVGQGMSINQGCEDDLMGYDKSLNLGYTYDSDGYEPEWTTTAGYIGCVLCETPGDIGFTGFQVWARRDSFEILIDDDRQDSLKYIALSTARPDVDTFMIVDSAIDVRQLSCSGPYLMLQPGEEVDFTVAIVAGYTLDSLREHAQNAITQFNNGYVVVVGVEESHNSDIPAKYALLSNSPNPFKLSTEIRYALQKSSWVNLSIYNMAGQKVATLVSAQETMGYKKVKWNGKNDEGKKLRSGVYFYKLKAGDYKATRKLTIIR